MLRLLASGAAEEQGVNPSSAQVKALHLSLSADKVPPRELNRLMSVLGGAAGDTVWLSRVLRITLRVGPVITPILQGRGLRLREGKCSAPRRTAGTQ